VIGVSGMHHVIPIAVKNDGRDNRQLVFENFRAFSGRGRVIGEAPYRLAEKDL
jgi:hypothetical protein